MKNLTQNFTKKEIIEFTSISDVLPSADEGLFHFAVEFDNGDTIFSENGTRFECEFAIGVMKFNQWRYNKELENA